MGDGRQKQIPNRLRRHRKMMGYTQKEIAVLLGHSLTDRISQWEKGTKYPGLINLIQLSLIYHVFPTDLYYDLMKILREEMEERKKSLGFKDVLFP